MENTFFRDIRFTSKYYEILEHCLTYFKGKYNVVHLRLEDDWLTYFSPLAKLSPEKYTIKLAGDYYVSMKKLFSADDTIFLATHLLKSKNTNNHLIAEFQKTYPNIIFTIPWRDKFSDFMKGREIDAIVDYLICLNGEKFIGLYYSTFSRIIGNIYQLNGKVSRILN